MDLRPFLNVADENGFCLVVLWLLAALSGRGPYPILALSGEQGSGKSVFSRMLRRLVDPVGDGVLQPPKDERDLIAVARGNHILAFDNISTMPADLADSLCRLSTGGDIGGRKLYTDNELAIFSAYRPIVLNGILDLATCGDLASLAVFVRLQHGQRLHFHNAPLGAQGLRHQGPGRPCRGRGGYQKGAARSVFVIGVDGLKDALAARLRLAQGPGHAMVRTTDIRHAV